MSSPTPYLLPGEEGGSFGSGSVEATAPRASLPPERRRPDRLVTGVTDSSHIRDLQGGLTGPSPVDRARTGSKHHLLVDAAGVPLAVILTDGNRNDITQLLPLLDDIMPVACNSALRDVVPPSL